MAKTQYNKHVCIIRSDNALEFDDHQCKLSFLIRESFTKLHVSVDPNKTGGWRENTGTFLKGPCLKVSCRYAY